MKKICAAICSLIIALAFSGAALAAGVPQLNNKQRTKAPTLPHGSKSVTSNANTGGSSSSSNTSGKSSGGNYGQKVETKPSGDPKK